MDAQNVLSAKNRSEFRSWLAGNSQIASECWGTVKRGKPTDETEFWYIDAVEEALCFGWIDSNHKLINGVRMQRFIPRKKNSPWTELNKERVRRLEKLSLMTDAGRAVLPAMGVRSYKLDADVEAALKQARVYSKFKTFPALYQRTRGYNVSFYKKRAPETYEKMLARLISETKQGKMFGEWNDYGRLLNY